MRIPILLAGLIAVAAFSACDPCRKLAKSSSIADKDSAAYCYYERGQYEAAAQFFEELMTYYTGDPKLEAAMYMYAQARMRNGEMITSSYYFQDFVQRFPNSDYTEEATYNIGYSYYLLSLSWELDQTYSKRAIEYYQLFLKVFPESAKAPEATEKIQELRNRLAKKAFKQAELYYRMERYQAAVVALKNMQLEYPDTEYREKVYYELFVSGYFLADRSIESKKLERFEQAETYYLNFIERFPGSEYLRQAETYYEDVQAELVRLRAEREANGPLPIGADDEDL